MNNFGKFLKEKAVNISSLANMLGFSRVTVSNHANGKTRISLDSARKYADFFGIDYKEFVNKFVL